MWCSPVGNHFPPVFPAIKPGPGSPLGTHALAKVPYQVTFHIHGYLWIWHLVFMDIHGYLEHIHGYLWIVHRAYAFKLTKSGLVVHILLVRHRGSSLVGVHRWNPSRSRSSFGIQHVFLLKDITVLLEVLKSCFNKLRINLWINWVN